MRKLFHKDELLVGEMDEKFKKLFEIGCIQETDPLRSLKEAFLYDQENDQTLTISEIKKLLTALSNAAAATRANIPSDDSGTIPNVDPDNSPNVDPANTPAIRDESSNTLINSSF